MTQSEDLDRLDNQWCQDFDEQWVYDYHCDEAVDAIKLLCFIDMNVMWKKNVILSYGSSQLYRWEVVSEVRWATMDP